MSFYGNCGKSGQTNLFFCKMMLVGVVLCMSGQYRLFPPLAVIITPRHRGRLATRHHWRSTGIYTHLASRAWRSSQRIWWECPYWRLQGPIHLKYVPWGCSLAILQTAPSWRRCPAEGNQGQPRHDEGWHYCLGSDSYPRNTAWQMALTKDVLQNAPIEFTSDVSLGAQEAIWRHCEKLPGYVHNHHKLGHYEPDTYAGSAHQVNYVH